jgi:hypothetical protein
MEHDPFDVVLETLQAQTAELHKLHGICCALICVCRALVKDSEITSDPEKSIEKLMTHALFSKLPDAQIEAAGRTLNMLLLPDKR